MLSSAGSHEHAALSCHSQRQLVILNRGGAGKAGRIMHVPAPLHPPPPEKFVPSSSNKSARSDHLFSSLSELSSHLPHKIHSLTTYLSPLEYTTVSGTTGCSATAASPVACVSRGAVAVKLAAARCPHDSLTSLKHLLSGIHSTQSAPAVEQGRHVAPVCVPRHH